MGAVMDIYKLIRDLIEEAKKQKDLDMVNSLIDIKLKVTEIEDENRELRRNLELRDSIVRHSDGVYITIKDDTENIQYCSTCWGNEGKLIQLKPEGTVASGFPRCPICYERFFKARK